MAAGGAVQCPERWACLGAGRALDVELDQLADQAFQDRAGVGQIRADQCSR